MGYLSNHDVTPIAADARLRVEDLEKSGRFIDLSCLDTVQRNWSRVGRARQAEDGPAQYFLKQYLDRAGNSHPKHCHFEQDGARLASRILGQIVHVPTLRFCNQRDLINVFDYCRVESVDRLLRRDEAELGRRFDAVVDTLVQVLEAMKGAGDAIPEGSLAVKDRDFGGPSTALNFKGFDIRNVGMPVDEQGRLEARVDRLAVFDFVRPYLAPIEEAGAKLMISIGLLNWGKPLRRFVLGPNVALLDAALPKLAPYLDKRALEVEIHIQHSFRTAEFHGRHALERMAKQIGIATFGRVYFRQLRRWCESRLG